MARQVHFTPASQSPLTSPPRGAGAKKAGHPSNPRTALPVSVRGGGGADLRACEGLSPIWSHRPSVIDNVARLLAYNRALPTGERIRSGRAMLTLAVLFVAVTGWSIVL